MFAGGIHSKKVTVDCDYTYWLGKGYKDGYRQIKKTSTIVCNHVSWFDT